MPKLSTVDVYINCTILLEMQMYRWTNGSTQMNDVELGRVRWFRYLCVTYIEPMLCWTNVMIQSTYFTTIFDNHYSRHCLKIITVRLKVHFPLLGWIHNDVCIERGYLEDTDFPSWVTEDLRGIIHTRVKLWYGYTNLIRSRVSHALPQPPAVQLPWSPSDVLTHSSESELSPDLLNQGKIATTGGSTGTPEYMCTCLVYHFNCSPTASSTCTTSPRVGWTKFYGRRGENSGVVQAPV